MLRHYKVNYEYTSTQLSTRITWETLEEEKMHRPRIIKSESMPEPWCLKHFRWIPICNQSENNCESDTWTAAGGWNGRD
jgi:hypothetical protein